MFKAPNSIYTNWDKDLYIARKKEVIVDDYNNEILTYDTPFYFGKVNYQPLTVNNRSLEAYMKVYGETENSVICAYIDSKDADKFRIFDLAYLYGATPENESVNGQNANYIVRAFKPQNTRIMVLFEEVVKKEEK